MKVVGLKHHFILLYDSSWSIGNPENKSWGNIYSISNLLQNRFRYMVSLNLILLTYVVKVTGYLTKRYFYPFVYWSCLDSSFQSRKVIIGSYNTLSGMCIGELKASFLSELLRCDSLGNLRLEITHYDTFVLIMYVFTAYATFDIKLHRLKRVVFSGSHISSLLSCRLSLSTNFKHDTIDSKKIPHVE